MIRTARPTERWAGSFLHGASRHGEGRKPASARREHQGTTLYRGGRHVTSVSPMQRTAARSLRAAKVPAEIEVYPRDQHGWCVADMPMAGDGTPIYNKTTGTRWIKLLGLYIPHWLIVRSMSRA